MACQSDKDAASSSSGPFCLLYDFVSRTVRITHNAKAAAMCSMQLSTGCSILTLRRREVARLAIGGLELPAGLGRRGLDGLLGWEGDPVEELRCAFASECMIYRWQRWARRWCAWPHTWM